ncbi:hypothetical protein F4805DRAFT_5958 [Annulohypoxylon moriforme]|nr:hypothetical protein F4805DRAFT_5958 [Annulohypoxylon moriforme]
MIRRLVDNLVLSTISKIQLSLVRVSSVSSSCFALYRIVNTALDDIIKFGNKIKWNVNSLVADENMDMIPDLPSPCQLEALRIMGDAEKGHGKMPKVIKTKLHQTGLVWVMQPEDARSIPTFWMTYLNETDKNPGETALSIMRGANMLYDIGLHRVRGMIQVNLLPVYLPDGVVLASALEEWYFSSKITIGQIASGPHLKELHLVASQNGWRSLLFQQFYVRGARVRAPFRSHLHLRLSHGRARLSHVLDSNSQSNQKALHPDAPRPCGYRLRGHTTRRLPFPTR